MIINQPTILDLYDRAGTVQPKLASVTGGDVTIEKMDTQGNWIEVDGSPLTDGQQRELITDSANGNIRVTNTGGTPDFNLINIL